MPISATIPKLTMRLKSINLMFSDQEDMLMSITNYRVHKGEKEGCKRRNTVSIYIKFQIVSVNRR